MPNTYRETLPWLARLSDNIMMAYPRATVSWDTANVTLTCRGGLIFGTRYTGWGKKEFEEFEQECLSILEVYT